MIVLGLLSAAVVGAPARAADHIIEQEDAADTGANPGAEAGPVEAISGASTCHGDAQPTQVCSPGALEPQALLALEATMCDRSEAVPTFIGGLYRHLQGPADGHDRTTAHRLFYQFEA